MRTFMGLVAGVEFLLAVLVFGVALNTNSAIHEIEAILLGGFAILGWTVLAIAPPIGPPALSAESSATTLPPGFVQPPPAPVGHWNPKADVNRN